MMKTIIPSPVRIWLRTRIRQAALNGANLPLTAVKYVPYKCDTSSYFIPKKPGNTQEVCKRGLPIPPKELWLGYGTTKEEYLTSGEVHVHNMFEAVTASGFSLKSRDRILDFGCGSGRMIRHLKRQSESCEIWGTDINANFVYWCQQYLEPPFHFVTTTTVPHLPFEDGYFDFVYAGSVFTHIDDLADAWLLELRRVLSREGRLYLTIHDNHTMELLETIYSHTWLSKVISSDVSYNASRGSAGKIVLGRDADSLVFYDIDYFKNMLNSKFDVISVTPEAYDYQTGVLLKHRSKSLNSKD